MLKDRVDELKRIKSKIESDMTHYRCQIATYTNYTKEAEKESNPSINLINSFKSCVESSERELEKCEEAFGIVDKTILELSRML